MTIDYEADEAIVNKVFDRVTRGATEHRRIMADEEAAVLRMLYHYRERAFELASANYQAGLVSMSLGEAKTDKKTA